MTYRQTALVRTAMTADERLDDLSRARIWNALASRLAANDDVTCADAAGGANARSHTRRTVRWGARSGGSVTFRRQV